MYKVVNNISIIGMSLSGKTTLGSNLAKKFDMIFFDLDLEVEKKLKMEISEAYNCMHISQISQIFIEVYEELILIDNCIIATSGYFGVYYDFKYIKNIYFLDISFEIFLLRIKNSKKYMYLRENKNRKILKLPLCYIEKDYKYKKPIYISKATHSFKVDTLIDLLKIENYIKKTFIN